MPRDHEYCFCCEMGDQTWLEHIRTEEHRLNLRAFYERRLKTLGQAKVLKDDAKSTEGPA